MTNNRDTQLKMKIMPHKENESAAVFIEGFDNEREARRFCMAISKLDGFEFINFLGQGNEK